MSVTMWNELFVATMETIYMVVISGVLAALVGIPLGTLLKVTQRGNILENMPVYKILGYVVNATRSIPFIILLIAIVPFTRLIAGTSIGTTAAIVPLTVGAIPFYARMVENTLNEVSYSLIEAGLAMGSSPWQVISKILLPESLPGLINAFTVLLINLIGFSAMAGAIGGGGLGDLAVRFGYQRFDVGVMVTTVIILIIIVQILQIFGDYIVKKISNHK